MTVARAAERPAPGPPRPYRFPHFERRALESGLQLVVATVHKLPLVTVVALVDAGAIADPPGREGLATLTARLLLEGAPAGQPELAERFERLGATIDASVDWDATVVRTTGLASRLPDSLALLGEVLRAPRFPEREVERLKAERLAELLQLRAEPRGLADEAFARAAYASGSRYASPQDGSETSVPALARDDVAAFFAARYQPPATTLVIAGDVSADEAERLVRQTFGDWRGARPAAAVTSDAPARQTRAVHFVAKSDAAQSELRVGHVALPRRHPDYFAAVVMNAVLGGLFSSRINLNLREAHAYTYGASSYFDWRRQRGPFVVSTAVQSDVTAAAAREVFTEIDRMRADPIGAAELSLATSYLDGVLPIRYETTDAIAGALASLVLFGLEDDYFDRYRERIRAVTAADVLRVAQAHLRPEAMQLVVVGDPGQVREPLMALDAGPMTVYDTHGRTREEVTDCRARGEEQDRHG